MTSGKFLRLSRDSVPEYHHAKFGCSRTTNKEETEGGTMYLPPAYMVPKDPSLNRVNYSRAQLPIRVLGLGHVVFIGLARDVIVLLSV